MCLIRKSWKMCSVGVPPGTGLGNIALTHAFLLTVEMITKNSCYIRLILTKFLLWPIDGKHCFEAQVERLCS